MFRFFGHFTIVIRAAYLGGPPDHWISMFWWSDIISRGLGPPDHCQCRTLLTLGSLYESSRTKGLVILTLGSLYESSRTRVLVILTLGS